MSAEEEQTFDVRLTLNEAVSSDAGMKSLSGNEMFERRRVKGCAALRIKAYKNLLGAGEITRRIRHMDVVSCSNLDLVN